MLRRAWAGAPCAAEQTDAACLGAFVAQRDPDAFAVLVSIMSGRELIFTNVDAEAKGRFRIAELPAGTWNVIIRGSDGIAKLHEEKVTLRTGETKDLIIGLKKD